MRGFFFFFLLQYVEWWKNQISDLEMDSTNLWELVGKSWRKKKGGKRRKTWKKNRKNNNFF